jgi:hypothetical protein
VNDHSHLDQQRRARGECPACDELWAWQDHVIEQHHWDEVAEGHVRPARHRLDELNERRYGRSRRV